MTGRILVTGASGLLGGRLVPELRRLGHEVECPDLDALDLHRPETVHRVIARSAPSVVIHLAADARVDRCEEHPDEAFRTNAQGTVHVAQAARSAGARLILMSTDYVFDGAQSAPYREYHATSPINVYGRSKEEAERAVLAIAPDRLIVRSSSLFGTGGASFVGAILDRAKRGEDLRVVDDQTQAPTWVGHLAPALACASLSQLQGIVHVAGSGSCTWFEFARAILEASGFGRLACAPISSEESNRPAPRPRYSVLDCRLAAEAFGIALPDWREGLEGHLKEIGAWRS